MSCFPSIKYRHKNFYFLGACLGLFSIFAQIISAQSSALIEQEMTKRAAAIEEGQMLMIQGDKAYEAGKYAEAATAFSGARVLFPVAPTTLELRDAATQRYAQAAVMNGRQLVKEGNIAEARNLIDGVLAEGVAPTDPMALAFSHQLDDPVRTNPALSKDFAVDVDQARRLLYMAQGSFDLGKYDDAKSRYEEVLRIDPYNKAARRGMEQVARAKSGYAKTAYDFTRGELLSQVAGGWELPLEPESILPENPFSAGVSGNGGDISLRNKISRIIIPDFRFEGGTLLEAIDLLRLRAAENDQFELDPQQKGVNINVSLGDPGASPAKEILEKTFDLSLSNVPLEEILNYIGGLTGTSLRVDNFAVTLVAAGAGSGELISRTYRVPPDFLSNLSVGVTAAEPESSNPFNTEIGTSAVLTERLGVQEVLQQQGVTFPDGASANLDGSTGVLRVINTFSNQDIIDQIVSTISMTEPVSVAVSVTMIKVERNVLEEIGFDWLLSNFEVGRVAGSGGRELNITGGSVSSGSPISDVAPLVSNNLAVRPLTAGNRSGDGAFSGDSINSLIAAGTNRGSQSQARAPGILGVNGILNNATVQTLMRGLDQKKSVDLMSQPSVTTRSGQAASILLVDEFIYPTEYDPPQLPTTVGTTGGPAPVTPATPTAFEKRDVGITLEVLPVADANKQYVDVTLTPTVTDFDGFVNYGSPINTITNSAFGSQTQELSENAILMPVFSTRRANSNLVVADGATVVMASLLRDEISLVNDKTPILGDIPVVGRLFQSNGRKHTSTAIVFLVNVRLLDPTGRPYSDR